MRYVLLPVLVFLLPGLAVYAALASREARNPVDGDSRPAWALELMNGLLALILGPLLLLLFFGFLAALFGFLIGWGFEGFNG